MRSRRAIAALLAIYSMVIASGAPLPIGWIATSVAPLAGEDVPTERFPCEGCPCGCGTAARCWAKCCCHTLPQRLAWARREGVRPPEDALDRAAKAGLDIRDWRSDAVYVVRLPENLKTELSSENDLPPCCRARLAKAEATQAAKPQAANPSAKPGVSLMHALACQGLAEAWLSFGEAPPITAAEVVTIDLVRTAYELPAPLWCSIDEAPTPPPPEGSGLFVS